jgi:hypothetical protein
MNKLDFQVGERLAEQGEYEKAFRFFQRVATDSNQNAACRADAYVWMGTLVRAEPRLGEGDECGFSFYRRALDLDPDNLWAMLGVADTFGDYVPDHQDKAAFRRAMQWLTQHWDSLDERVREDVIRIRTRNASILDANPAGEKTTVSELIPREK